jgi:hypothetical protein
LFDPLTIGLLLVNLALAYHVFRTGQSPMWLAALGLISLSSFVLGGIALLATFGLWGAYVFFAILPTFWNSRSGDPVLLKGLGRAKLLSGDGAAAEALFVQLRQVDPAAMDADVELDYARALEAQGKNDAAIQRYEGVAPRYPGEEARARFALLLEKTGQADRAQAVFREIIASVKNAPGHYRSRQSEWLKIAKQHLKN